MNNEIFVGGNAINKTATVLSSLNRKITDINRALGAQSYDDILQSLKNKTVDPSDMSLDEYKQYVVDKIQSMPVNPTHWLDNETIVISDKGYEAMQADPEYEAWVLDSIADILSTPDLRTGLTPKLEHFAVHSFGASKEEYRGQSWSREKNRRSSRRRTVIGRRGVSARNTFSNCNKRCSSTSNN